MWNFFSSSNVNNHQSYRLVYQEWWTLRLTLQYLQFFSPKELHFSTNKIHMVFTFAYCTELCKTVLLDIFYLDILFHQIARFIKVCLVFLFGLQTFQLKDFSTKAKATRTIVTVEIWQKSISMYYYLPTY